MVLLAASTLKWAAVWSVIILNVQAGTSRSAGVDDIDGPTHFATERACREHVRVTTPKLKALLIKVEFPAPAFEITIGGRCEKETPSAPGPKLSGLPPAL